MEIRKFGSQGLFTSQLGLGCMGMAEFYGPADDAESIKVIHRAIEQGLPFFDTADELKLPPLVPLFHTSLLIRAFFFSVFIK